MHNVHNHFIIFPIQQFLPLTQNTWSVYRLLVGFRA